MRWIKVIRTVLIAIVAITALLAGAGFIFQGYLNRTLKELFIRELNKSLTAEVRVSDIRFSLFRDFPYASLQAEGIVMKDARNINPKGILLQAQNLSLQFNIRDILRKRYSIKNIRLSDASIHLKVFADGSNNFHFWKQSQSVSESPLAFNLQNIRIRNVEISYSDPSSGANYSIRVKHGKLKGNFSGAAIRIETEADFSINNLTYDSNTFFAGNEANADFMLDIDNKTGIYRFSKGFVTVEKLRLSLEGIWQENEAGSSVDFRFTSNKLELEDIVSLVPEKYVNLIEEYSFRGRAGVSARVFGTASGGRTPGFSLQASFRNCTVRRQSTQVALSGLNMDAAFSILPGKNAPALVLKNVSAQLGNGILSGWVEMAGFENSQMKGNLKTDFDLSELHSFIRIESLKELKGRLKMEAGFNGLFTNIRKPVASDLQKMNINGSGQVVDGSIWLKGYTLPFRPVNATFNFSNNDVSVSSLQASAGKSSFTGKFLIKNLIPLILTGEGSLLIAGNLRAINLDGDEISTLTESSGERAFTLPDVEAEPVHLTIEKFTFRKFSATSLSADISLKKRILTGKNIVLKAMQGVITGEANLNNGSGKNTSLQCRANVSRVNIKELFRQFGNFGNTGLTHENLDGFLTAEVIFAGIMNPALEVDAGTVKTHADLKIENGRLVNYAPMQALSKFIRVEDLSDIRFSTLQNQIDIANEIIFIPAMKISSSALDLELMGTHTFRNELDYHFSLFLGDLLAAKYKKRNPVNDRQAEFGPIEEDGRGRTRLFISMTGDVDNPVFKYDKKNVREKIATDLGNQKLELKEALRKEFSLPPDSVRRARTAREKEIRKMQEEGKFVIEWDDDKK